MSKGGGDQSRYEQYPPPPASAPYYGTFPGPPAYPHGEPAIGFPQPVPPPSAPPAYDAHGYQAVPAYAIAEGTPVAVRTGRERRMPCCGCGLGWCLFIIGFFLAGIPWYIGAFVLLCVRTIDYREKPGYIACTIGACLATIAIVLGVTKGTDAW